jgi:hypothetical protein
MTASANVLFPLQAAGSVTSTLSPYFEKFWTIFSVTVTPEMVPEADAVTRTSVKSA